MMPSGINDDAPEDFERDQMMSALFAHMVSEYTNVALMLLGRNPHPESGEKMFDPDSARLFIDQLEMLEVKTKGNLSPGEQRLLQQSLTHLRLAFVETMERPPQPAAPAAPEISPASTPDAGEASGRRSSMKF